MARLEEPQDERRQTRKRLAFLVIIIVLPLIAGAILWILSAAGLIAGPWSSLFAAVFTAIGAVSTVIGVIIALFQWNRPSAAGTSPRPSSPPTLRERTPAVYLEEFNLGANRRKGALLVKVTRKLGGATINLYRGFDRDDSSVDVASNVVLRMVDGSPTFVAIFPALEPGRYTVAVPSTGFRANVTILAGQVSEIDWRYTRRRASSTRWRVG